MLKPANHLSNADLLRLIDHEALSGDTESMQNHLLTCADCSARLASSKRTLGYLDDLFALQSSMEPSGSTASRVRLQKSLRVAAVASERSRWSDSVIFVQVGAIAAVVLVAAGIGVHGWKRAVGEPVSSQYLSAGPIPNRTLTPGAIRPVTLGEICRATDDDDLDPSVAPAIQSAVLREYGIAGASSRGSYQIDYLVNPQLGGTNDIKNLWPQPYHEGLWNARAKDELEKHLHEMVCNRTVELTVAQREIATDWIAAYKKYLRSQPV